MIRDFSRIFWEPERIGDGANLAGFGVDYVRHRNEVPGIDCQQVLDQDDLFGQDSFEAVYVIVERQQAGAAEPVGRAEPCRRRAPADPSPIYSRLRQLTGAESKSHPVAGQVKQP